MLFRGECLQNTFGIPFHICRDFRNSRRLFSSLVTVTFKRFKRVSWKHWKLFNLLQVQVRGNHGIFGMFEIIRSSKSDREMNNQTILQTPTLPFPLSLGMDTVSLSFSLSLILSTENTKRNRKFLERWILHQPSKNSSINRPSVKEEEQTKKTSFNPHTYASRYVQLQCVVKT